MRGYSVFSLLRHGVGGNRRWPLVWRKAAPKANYDVIIVGGGGHGLACAYYLAREHGLNNVVVLEKGWIGSGNAGRNTAIIRSNYLLPGNSRFYEKSMQLWQGLSRELNYNVMYSARGVINLAHSPAQMDGFTRRGNAMRLEGIDAEIVDLDFLRARVPGLDLSAKARFPILGGLLQPRGGTARHDAVVWGYARAADALGVDIIENCAVEGFLEENGQMVGVETSRGVIRAKKIGVSVAGSTSDVLRRAGIGQLPIESHVLQAFVSEPLKPLIDTVVTFGAGHLYISQSDKGGLVFGGDLDGYNSYAQRGNLPVIQEVAETALEMFPNLGRLRMLRHWGGIMDMSMDGSPIISVGPKPGLYLNAGWCYGGFKATPAAGWCFAWTIAKDAPHDLNAAFRLDRFRSGLTLDENGAGPTPGHH